MWDNATGRLDGSYNTGFHNQFTKGLHLDNMTMANISTAKNWEHMGVDHETDCDSTVYNNCVFENLSNDAIELLQNDWVSSTPLTRNLEVRNSLFYTCAGADNPSPIFCSDFPYNYPGHTGSPGNHTGTVHDNKYMFSSLPPTGAPYSFIGGPSNGLRDWNNQNMGSRTYALQCNFDKDLSGFAAGSSINGFVRRLGGYCEGDIAGSNAFIQSGDNLGCDLTTNPTVWIRYYNGSNAHIGRIAFTTVSDQDWTDTKSGAFYTNPNDSLWTEYRFDMGDNAAWQGELKQVRFFPAPGVSTGKFCLDFLRIGATNLAPTDSQPTHLVSAVAAPRASFRSIQEEQFFTLDGRHVGAMKSRNALNRRGVAGVYVRLVKYRDGRRSLDKLMVQ
jgi:hypothetical protein